jgi:hypothetical protein
MNVLLSLLAAGFVIWILYQEGNSSSGSNAVSATITPIMKAIENAEGGAKNGSNNPGSLAYGDLGNGVFNSAGVTVYPSLDAGWQALSDFLAKEFTGATWYDPSMTVQEFANSYVNGPYGDKGIDDETTGSDNWVSNFLRSLSNQGITGFSSTSLMGDVVSAAS